EILDVEIEEYRLLCHSHFEVGMAVPPGEGLLAFVIALNGNPISVGALRENFDDQQLLDKILTSLRLHGFVHLTSQAMPSIPELGHLRNIVERARETILRRSIVVDLDVPGSMEHLCANLNTGETPPEVLLRCA